MGTVNCTVGVYKKHYYHLDKMHLMLILFRKQTSSFTGARVWKIHTNYSSTQALNKVITDRYAFNEECILSPFCNTVHVCIYLLFV